MEQLMVDLLDATRSRKNYDGIPPYIRPTFHLENFIRQEDFRSESSLFSTDETSRSSFGDYAPRTVDSASTDSSLPGDQTTDLSTGGTSPTYVSYSNDSWYQSSSPPTYIAGDYHDISLPDALSVSSLSDPTPGSSSDLVATEVTKLPFSIDSLLSDSLQDSNGSLDSAPASVVSYVQDDFYTAQPYVSETPANTTEQTTGNAFAYPVNQQNLNDPQRQPAFNFEMFSQVKSKQTNAVSSTIFWCHVCARFCSSAESAEKHNTAHALEGLKCDLRDVFFRKCGYVTVHENTGFLDRIKCGLCSKIICGRYFVKHLRVHDGHRCETCFREFSSKGRLRDHKNEHTGELPYACTECPRRFGSRNGLTQHVRRHLVVTSVRNASTPRTHVRFMNEFTPEITPTGVQC